MRDSGEFRTLSAELPGLYLGYMSARESGGGRKKFLYTGPVSSKGQQEEDQWSFSPKINNPSTTANTPRGMPINLDDVWSIRNVGLKSGSQSVRSEPASFQHGALNKTSQTSFYSRHGGLKNQGQGGQENRLGNPSSSGTSWSSSGHAFSQSSRRNQPPLFQKPDRGSQDSSQRHNPSPFTRDINDF